VILANVSHFCVNMFQKVSGWTVGVSLPEYSSE